MVQGTGSTLGLGSDHLSIVAIEVVSDADLIRSVENLKKQVLILRLENEVLEATIMRLQPSLMTGMYSALEYAMKLSQSASTIDGTSRSRFALTDSSRSRFTLIDTARSSSNIKSQSRIFHRKLDSSLRTPSVKISRSIIGGTGPKINVEEKLELVHAVMENQGKDLKKLKSTAKKQNAYLKAQLEEITLRTIDFEKWTLEFEQEVVIDGVEAITKRIPAETWIRFMTEHGKKIDRQIEKLRLRTSTANTRHSKLRDDIKRKKDLVTRLLPIDIKVKTIENAEAQKVIERKNDNLSGLIALTGDLNLNVTRHKDDLKTMTNYLTKVQQEKVVRDGQTVKLDAEREILEAQVIILEERLNWIQKQRKAYFVPDVLDYVRIELELSELKNSIKRLETSLSIKQCAITSFKKKSLNLSKILLSKKKLKSKGESTNTSGVCEVATKFNASKKVCNPCGLLPRD